MLLRNGYGLLVKVKQIRDLIKAADFYCLNVEKFKSLRVLTRNL